MLLTHLNWRRSSRFLFGVVAVVLCINLGRLIYVRSARAQIGASVPYTVLRKETGFDKAGTPKYTIHYAEAVRSDGARMRRITEAKSEQRKLFFANGDEVRTNDFLFRKSTYPKVRAGALSERSPQNSCVSDEDRSTGWVLARQDSIQGHPAARLFHAAGGRTWTTWFALNEGCALLRMRLEHETGVTEQELAALIVGEPDAALFEVPASFLEVPPSRLQENCSASGGCRPVMPESVSQRLDQHYYEVRAKTP